MPQPRFDPRAPRATRLVGLELRNFKSVRHADVPLGPLTVIAGANSSGKSSLLQAVLALTQVTRRRIEGHRFPLNDELARLGTFEAIRHQRAEPEEPVRIAARFVSDDRDVRMNAAIRLRPLGQPAGPRQSREALPVDVRWSVELDASMQDQIGSAQIAAIEVRTTGGGLATSARLERTNEESLVRSQRDDLGGGLAFTGSMRSGDTETAVLDALISSGQFGALFGVPPEPPVRVRDWFLSLADLPRQDRLFDAGAPQLDREEAIRQAVWAIREDVPGDPEFVDWYDRLDGAEQERVERAVLDGFVREHSVRRRSLPGGVEVLEGRGPTRLDGAQRACARFLSSRVRYVGPLRHAPHLPFPSAPDPDLGDVGISGEHVASVLQANKATERGYPVPDGGAERLSLTDAVNRWLVFFGLADELRVREDVPLVLGIDVVPPGLDRPVALAAVGVGVSQVLPVLVQCLVAGPGALVVLEQPELHLHPAAQQRLGDFLLACSRWGQALLVESHSEYLVLRLRRRIAEDPTDELRDHLVLVFASRDDAGSTTYQPVELTETGAVVEWPPGFFDQGPDEAHQLLVAAATKQRQRTGGVRG